MAVFPLSDIMQLMIPKSVIKSLELKKYMATIPAFSALAHFEQR